MAIILNINDVNMRLYFGKQFGRIIVHRVPVEMFILVDFFAPSVHEDILIGDMIQCLYFFEKWDVNAAADETEAIMSTMGVKSENIRSKRGSDTIASNVILHNFELMLILLNHNWSSGDFAVPMVF